MAERPFTLTVFSADTWEHVCPVVRITGPASQAGVRVIHGNEWVPNQERERALRVFPERVADADLVVIQRDFPSLHAGQSPSGGEETPTTPYEVVLREARRLGKRIVYELDDLLTELPPEHPGARRYLPGRLAILRADQAEQAPAWQAIGWTVFPLVEDWAAAVLTAFGRS